MEFLILLLIATVCVMPFYDPKTSSLLLSKREAAAYPQKARVREFLVRMGGSFIISFVFVGIAFILFGSVFGTIWDASMLINGH